MFLESSHRSINSWSEDSTTAFLCRRRHRAAAVARKTQFRNSPTRYNGPEMPDLATKPGVEEIPDKLYFRIGEVSRLAGIKPYVLRFWETEFPGLGPKKSGTGHRLYRRKDVELVLEIKRLLYDKRYTIEGARKILDRGRGGQAKAPDSKLERPSQRELFAGGAAMDQIRKELAAILEILS